MMYYQCFARSTIKSISSTARRGDGLTGRMANTLVKRYGQDAPIHAAMRADAILERGDLGGYRPGQSP